jgi:hypothetical protein
MLKSREHKWELSPLSQLTFALSWPTALVGVDNARENPVPWILEKYGIITLKETGTQNSVILDHQIK